MSKDRNVMRGRATLILVLVVFLTLGVALVLELWYVPSAVQYMVNTLTTRLFSSTDSQELAYSMVVYGAFVYVIILASAIVYLILSEVVRRLVISDN